MTSDILQMANVPKDVPWILFFGDGDVRVHIHKQAKIRELASIVGDLCGGYKSSIKQLNHKVAVSSAPPPARTSILLSTGSVFNGTDSERSGYARSLNAALKSMCEEEGWPFLDLASTFADAEGLLIDEYSDGAMHIVRSDMAWPLVEALGIF